MTQIGNMPESLPPYPTTDYLYWLNPNMSEEQRQREEAIHRKMSQMLVKSYWKQIHEAREAKTESEG